MFTFPSPRLGEGPGVRGECNPFGIFSQLPFEGGIVFIYLLMVPSGMDGSLDSTS